MSAKCTLKQIVTCAVLAALVCVTTLISIPTPPFGNINFGDAFILVSVFVLGPWYGAVCAAVGASLADLLSGYVMYAPATFVIKALMAIVCGLIYRWMLKSHVNPTASMAIGAVCAELVMTGGYFVYEVILYGSAAAVVNIPFNLIQGACGAIIGVVISFILFKNKATLNFMVSLWRDDKNDKK